MGFIFGRSVGIGYSVKRYLLVRWRRTSACGIASLKCPL
jgi:hypothetical protein